MLSAAAGASLFWSFYVGKGGSVCAAAAVVPLAGILSILLARLIHWYCRTDSYAGFWSAMTDYSQGGYALLGAFCGCFLAVGAMRLLRVSDNLFRMLDSMSLAGCLAIALGRLSCLFNGSDRGGLVLWKPPLSWPVINPVSGMEEQRLAVFFFQSAAAGLIFLWLVWLYLRRENNLKTADGDVTLLFLLLYGGTQMVFDSMRYDSLFLRSNGFISLVQLSGALAVVGSIVLISVRLVRAREMQSWYIPTWGSMLLLLGRGGYMEYYVQRHGDRAMYAYGVMGTCVAGTLMLAVILWVLTARRERLLSLPTIY